MTTIPANFNPTIPPRGTKEFREYAASVMLSNGPFVVSVKSIGDWSGYNLGFPSWDWNLFDYAIIPQPKITYRWYTREEFMRLVPTHGLFLVRLNGVYSTASFMVTIEDCFFAIPGFPNCRKGNFHEYEKSLDGGITWEPVGVRVES